eukprot:2538853-Rhodomonas_salina.4
MSGTDIGYTATRRQHWRRSWLRRRRGETLSSYVLAIRSPRGGVQSGCAGSIASPTVLRACYAMSSTDRVCAAPIVLPVRHATSGTDLANAASRWRLSK